MLAWLERIAEKPGCSASIASITNRTSLGSSHEETPMTTEAEWLDAGFRRRMDFLRGRAGERNLLLFAVGCCRSVWHLLPIHRQRLVVAMDRSADDEVARNHVLGVDDPSVEIQERPGTQ